MIVFVTGGSGFLGREVLARLLRDPSCEEVVLLLRSSAKQSVEQRRVELIEKICGAAGVALHGKRIRAIGGDLTSAGLGLSSQDRLSLVNSVTHVLHLGASTDFGTPIDISRRFNVEGTRKVLNLALDMKSKGKLQRFDYVSTAYVAGTKSGSVSEQDLMRGQSFANPYEQSKYEAELLVRDYFQSLPIAIYRPSVVVGQSLTGFTPHFKVLYWPIRLLSKGLLPFFPINRRAVLDVVPVDFVADGMVALMKDQNAIGHTFHLTAGNGQEAKLTDVVKDSFKYAEVKPVMMMPCWLFDLIAKSALRRFFREDFWEAVQVASPFRDYVYGTGVQFENTATLEWLRKFDIEVPLWSDYREAVLGFCVKSRWGKRLPMQEFEYYQNALGVLPLAAV